MASGFETASMIIAVVGGVIGAVGGTLGIVTSIRSERRHDQLKIDEQNDFAFLASLMQTQLRVGGFAGRIISEIETEEIGSEHWKRCEKMVERGILERGPKGRGYTIRGFEGLKPEPRKTFEPPSPPPIEIDRNR